MDFLYFSGCLEIPFYDDVCGDDGEDARVESCLYCATAQQLHF